MNVYNFPLFFLGICLILGAGAAGVCLFLYRRHKTKAKAIEATPQASIDKLDEGYWKTCGRAVSLENPLVSPMTSTKCLFYHFKVEELKSSTDTTTTHGRRGSSTQTRTTTYWETVVSDRQAVKCAVKDETGSARVDMLDADTELLPSAHGNSGTFNSCPEELKNTLRQRYAYSTKGMMLNKQLRYTEMVIEEGNELFVIGDVKKSAGEAEFVRGSQPFIVTNQSEAQLLRQYQGRATVCLIGAVVAPIILGLFALVPFLLIKSPQASNDPKKAAPAPAGPKKPNAVPNANGNGVAVASSEATNSGAPTAPARQNDKGVPVNTFAAVPDSNEGKGVEEKAINAKGKEAEEKYYRPVPKKELPWVATIDPPSTALTGPTSSWAAISVVSPPKKTLFPFLPSPYAVLYPKAAKGQKNADGLMQVYDLRTGSATGKPFVLKLATGEHAALALDGSCLVGRVPGRENPHTLEVIDTATGQSIRRIEAGHGKEWTHVIAFIGPDRLLTKTHEAQNPDWGEKTEYKVWNVRTGELLSQFAFDLVGAPLWLGLSGGGKYIVFQIGRTLLGNRLVTIEIATGKAVGDFIVVDKNEAQGGSQGIVFSPDGKEFAMLWRVGKKDFWGKVMVFDATNGKRLATHDLADMTGIETDFHGGLDSIQWIPDGSGWLIYGVLLIDRKTGKELGRLDAKKFAYRRFVGPQQVTMFKGGPDPSVSIETIKVAGH